MSSCIDYIKYEGKKQLLTGSLLFSKQDQIVSLEFHVYTWDDLRLQFNELKFKVKAT